MRYVLFGILLVIATLLGGCGIGIPSTTSEGQTVTPAATPVVSPTLESPMPVTVAPTETAYPAPQVSEEGAYPAPTLQAALEATKAALPTLSPLPTPEPGKGHVLGQIMRESDIRPREPLAGWTLYLGQVHRNVSGKIVPLASVIEETAPKAMTDAEVRYAFTNVEPGLYALIIKHPLTLVLAHDLLTDQDVVVEVVAGETTEQPLVVVTLSD